MHEYLLLHAKRSTKYVRKVTKMLRKPESAEFRQNSPHRTLVEKPVETVNNVMNNSANSRLLHKFENIENEENLTFYYKMRKNCDLCS